jgi:hypothetical protein
MPFTRTAPFVIGTNLPWIDGQYGHDLGHNPWTGARAYLDDRTSDFVHKVARLRGYFRQIREVFGFSLVRVWVFEGGEGIVHVAGAVRLDETLVAGVRTVLDVAESEGLRVYLMLMSSHPAHTPQAFAMDGELIRRTAARPREGFVSALLRPLLKQVGAHPALWGIDVINEPEKYAIAHASQVGVRASGVSWLQIQAMLVACADAIRDETHGRVRVSTGCAVGGWIPQSMRQALRRYTGLGLDFLDVHLYDDRGEIASDWRSLAVDEPCLIGEYGPRARLWSDTLQSMSTEGFLTQARDKGYMGALSWYYACPGFVMPPVPASYADALPSASPYRYSVVASDGTPRPVHQITRRFAGLQLEVEGHAVGDIGGDFEGVRRS